MRFAAKISKVIHAARDCFVVGHVMGYQKGLVGHGTGKNIGLSTKVIRRIWPEKESMILYMRGKNEL